ncbi:glycerophosphodiester phosphodiesterase family protein [Winogradskyella vincentii]|uniref:Glycerophosphodiester phosphodiesterase n=1 Tax=Winogradskyella vincentii TaxID=2877122 RepID=A0ABS7XW67_9FLAO|nr:glycerophosphodiester phosphodiesterase family protein [Winogradskyella vincentii]MCA0151611.1 glycerophosphodiester phosphodiesterase [Winogradskyella vincentii]
MSCTKHPEIDIQGHRGWRGLFPENSMPAFKKATELGVNTLELDIVVSKDKKVVVSHEPFMNPLICLDPKGEEIVNDEVLGYNLYNMDYAQIKEFDCGTKFHPDFPDQTKIKIYKPLLSDVFKLVKSNNSEVKFNIEIKSEVEYYGEYTPHPKEYVSIVIEELKKSGLITRVNLQSFDLNILEEIKVQYPKMVVALLVDEDEIINDKLSILTYKPQILSPYYKLLNPKNVSKFQSEGFDIIPWTINEEEDLKYMIKLKVDGIITDYPDRLIKILEAQSY